MRGQLSNSSGDSQEEIPQGLAQNHGRIDYKSYVLRLVTGGQRSAEAERVVYDYLGRDGDNSDKKDILLAMASQQAFLDRVLVWGESFIEDPEVVAQEKAKVVLAVLSKLEAQGVGREGYSVSNILRQEDIVSADKRAIIEKMLRIGRYSLTHSEQADLELGTYLEQDTVSTSDKAAVLRQVLSEDYRNINSVAFKRDCQKKDFSLDKADDIALVVMCLDRCIDDFPPTDIEPIIQRLLDSQGVSDANKLRLVEEIGHSEEVGIDFKINLVGTAISQREWEDNELMQLATVACRQYEEGSSGEVVRDRCSLIFSILSPVLIDERREQKIKVALLSEMIAQDIRLSRDYLEEEAEASYLEDERIVKLFPLAINHIATGSKEGIYLSYRAGLRVSTNQNTLESGTLRSVKVQEVFLSVLSRLMPELPREKIGAYLEFIWDQGQNINRQLEENEQLKAAITKAPWLFFILRKDDPLRINCGYIKQLAERVGMPGGDELILWLVNGVGHSEEVGIDFKIDLVKTALSQREWEDNELIQLATVACRQYEEGSPEEVVRDRCSLIFSILSPVLIDERREQKIKVALLSEMIAQDIRISRDYLEEEAEASYLEDERIIKLFPLAINHIATGSKEGIYLSYRTGLRVSTNQNTLESGTLRSVKVQEVFLSVLSRLMPELPRGQIGAYLEFIWDQGQNSNRQVEENEQLREAIIKVPWLFFILRKDDPLRSDHTYIEQLSQQAGMEIGDLLDQDGSIVQLPGAEMSDKPISIEPSTIRDSLQYEDHVTLSAAVRGQKRSESLEQGLEHKEVGTCKGGNEEMHEKEDESKQPGPKK